jgi:hypothetical protein
MIDTPRDHYNRDPHFKYLVDVQVQMIEKCEFSPTEMREAAMLACILYEERHTRITGVDMQRHTVHLHEGKA